jgi:hypothetical protein
MNWGLAKLARGMMAPALALSLGVAEASAAADQGQPKPAGNNGLTFGQLRAMDAGQARARAEALLGEMGGKADKARLDAIWATMEPLADKVADTLALGNPDIAKLLVQARGSDKPLPEGTPAWLKDDKQPLFARAAVALAVARTLSNRGAQDETLEMLRMVRPEQSIDPGSHLFLKAVAEHALVRGPDAQATLDRMLSDVADLSERHRMVGSLMQAELARWKDKDLGWISRKMEQIHQRLEIERGGKKTRDIQKEVLVRLDEMIKEAENQQKQAAASNQGNCPNGGKQEGEDGQGSGQPSQPQQDSMPGGPSGSGDVDTKKAKEIAEIWGKLPDRERAQAMRDLAARAPAKYRETLELYFKKLNETAPGAGRKNP